MPKKRIEPNEEDSLIFGKGELVAMRLVKEGYRRDPTGVFYRKAKPKITELLKKWFPRKRELEDMIKRKR